MTHFEGIPPKTGSRRSDLPPPADAAAREEALDPHRSFIVQAPAGSGKTSLLVQRYLTLLARVRKPEEILAITFTRKAAGEMRQRILQALRQAKHPSQDSDPHTGKTAELARAALQRNTRLGWCLEHNPSRLRIQTIDALCASLVEQMPLLSKLGLRADISEHPEALYREAAEQTVAELEAGAGWSAAVETLIRYLDNNLERVIDLIAVMLRQREQWLRHLAGRKDLGLQRRVLEQSFARLIRDSLERARQALEGVDWELILELGRFAAANLQAEDSPSMICRLGDLKRLPGTGTEDLDCWLGLCDLLLTAKGEWRRQVNKTLGFPAPGSTKDPVKKEGYASRKQAFFELLGRLSSRDALRRVLQTLRTLPAPTYSQEQWIILQALFEILPMAVAQLHIVFQSENQVDFSEIALRALEALGSEDDPTDLGLAWDNRLQHILMDEFQDTNQTQYRLIQQLTAGWQDGDGRTFFAVGDPMQSIYRFREAEVGLFLQTRRHGLGGICLSPLQLQVNFRSQQGLVDWINASFQRILPQDEDIASGRVPYSPCTAHQPADPAGGVHIHPFLENNTRAEADRIRDIITQTREQQPGGSIAVLVRSRSHLRELLPVLRRSKLSFQAVEIESLAQRPVIQDVLALTKALAFPGHRPAWLAVLRAPWCGLCLNDLHSLVGADLQRPVCSCLNDAQLVTGLSPQGREQVLKVRDILNHGLANRGRGSLRDLVEGVWLRLGGPACVPDKNDLDDVRVFFDLLSSRFSGLEPFQPSALDQALAELYAVPDAEADATLQVMTVHKAKGLEFDTVILPGLGRTWPADAHQLLLWEERARGAGRTDLLLAPMAEAGEEQGRSYRYLKGLKKEKAGHEEARVLYVAATRAMQNLHLLGHVTLDQSTGAMRKPAVNSALSCLWPALEADFQGVSEQACRTAAQSSDDSPALEAQPFSRLVSGWELPPPPPGLPADRNNPEEAEAAYTPVEFAWVGPLLPKVGTLVHAWLLRLVHLGEANWSRLQVTQHTGLYARQLAALGAGPDEAEEGAKIVATALERTLADPRGRWVLQDHPGGRCEFGLTGWIDGRRKSVVLDRTFVDASGIRWIIDFKVSRHSGGDPELFLDREQARYHEQMLGYARIMQLQDHRPLRLGLYFPLLQGWREWGI